MKLSSALLPEMVSSRFPAAPSLACLLLTIQHLLEASSAKPQAQKAGFGPYVASPGDGRTKVGLRLDTPCFGTCPAASLRLVSYLSSTRFRSSWIGFSPNQIASPGISGFLLSHGPVHAGLPRRAFPALRPEMGRQMCAMTMPASQPRPYFTPHRS